MKKRSYFFTIVLSFTLMMLSAVPAFAGTWTENEDNTWTYVNDDGESVTGWIEDGDDTYYLDKDGNRKTGWFKSKGSWYYFEEDGTLASETWVDNYYVNADGKLIKTK